MIEDLLRENGFSGISLVATLVLGRVVHVLYKTITDARDKAEKRVDVLEAKYDTKLSAVEDRLDNVRKRERDLHLALVQASAPCGKSDCPRLSKPFYLPPFRDSEP